MRFCGIPPREGIARLIGGRGGGGGGGALELVVPMFNRDLHIPTVCFAFLTRFSIFLRTFFRNSFMVNFVRLPFTSFVTR